MQQTVESRFAQNLLAQTGKNAEPNANQKTAAAEILQTTAADFELADSDRGCAGGACSL